MANKQKQLPKSRVSELHFEIAHKVDIALKIHQPTKLSFYVLSQLRMIIEYRYDYNERKKVCNTVLKMQVTPPPNLIKVGVTSLSSRYNQVLFVDITQQKVF